MASHYKSTEELLLATLPKHSKHGQDITNLQLGYFNLGHPIYVADDYSGVHEKTLAVLCQPFC